MRHEEIYPTEAHRVAALAGKYGDDPTTEFRAALENASGVYKCKGSMYAATRYGFSDGSAIVVSGLYWDLGVHDDRLADLAEGYEESVRAEGGMAPDIAYAWVRAGYGLDWTVDCLPAGARPTWRPGGSWPFYPLPQPAARPDGGSGQLTLDLVFAEASSAG